MRLRQRKNEEWGEKLIKVRRRVNGGTRLAELRYYSVGFVRSFGCWDGDRIIIIVVAQNGIFLPVTFWTFYLDLIATRRESGAEEEELAVVDRTRPEQSAEQQQHRNGISTFCFLFSWSVGRGLPLGRYPQLSLGIMRSTAPDQTKVHRETGRDKRGGDMNRNGYVHSCPLKHCIIVQTDIDSRR